MIVKVCKKHGQLTIDKCIKGNPDSLHNKFICKECKYAKLGKDKRKRDRAPKKSREEIKSKLEAKRKMRSEEIGSPETDQLFMFDAFMQISNKLIKKIAQHYQLHRRYS